MVRSQLKCWPHAPAPSLAGASFCTRFCFLSSRRRVFFCFTCSIFCRARRSRPARSSRSNARRSTSSANHLFCRRTNAAYVMGATSGIFTRGKIRQSHSIGAVPGRSDRPAVDRAPDWVPSNRLFDVIRRSFDQIWCAANPPFTVG